MGQGGWLAGSSVEVIGALFEEDLNLSNFSDILQFQWYGYQIFMMITWTLDSLQLPNTPDVFPQIL